MKNDDFVQRMRQKFLTRPTAWSASPSRPPVFSQTRSFQPQSNQVILPETRLALNGRGVVWSDIPTSWFIEEGGLRIDPLELDHVGVRGALLFADRFDVAESNLLGMEWPSKEILHGSELYQATMIRYGRADISHTRFVAADAFNALDAREPGQWTMARGAQSLGIPEHMLSRGQGFALVLDNALPVFDRSVPFAEILEFKVRRQAELIALRKYMQELVDEMIANGANDLETNPAFERFDQSLSDHMKVMQESNFSKVLTSFRASISWDLVVPAVSEIVLTKTVAGSGAVGAAALLAIKAVHGLRDRKSASPFEYLTIANQELY